MIRAHLMSLGMPDVSECHRGESDHGQSEEDLLELRPMHTCLAPILGLHPFICRNLTFSSYTIALINSTRAKGCKMARGVKCTPLEC